MSSDGVSLVITWPGWASDWALWSTTNLTPPVVWSPVASTVVSNNNQFSVSLPMNSLTSFFRLSSP